MGNLQIILQNGKKFDNAMALVRRFIHEDGSYAKYDEPYVAQNNVLSRTDVELVRCFQARTGKTVEDRILVHQTEIGRSLERIPVTSTLLDESENIVWEALEELLSIMISIKGVDIWVATKVLHKKRPALIPILDSVVQRYLLTVDNIAKTQNREKLSVDMMRSYKRDLDNNADAVRKVRVDLKQLGFYLTECRILDTFVWAYSGVYTPPFEKKRFVRQRAVVVRRAMALSPIS
jgi:hypothetical protein